MGVSRNRKDHKKKSKQRTEEIKINQRKSKQRMLEQYLEIQRKMAETTQVTGQNVENTDIDIDLGVDMTDDEFFVDEDVNIEPSEIIDEEIKE